MEEPKLSIQEACKNRFSTVLSIVEEFLQQEENIISNTSITEMMEQSCQEIIIDVKKPLLIGIDGMCCSGKTTLGYYIQHLKFFLTIDKEKQLEMIRLRNGEEMLKRFVSEWIPKEHAYFEAFQIARGCIQIPWEGL